MKNATFTLQPFLPDEDAAQFNLAGTLRRHANTLSVRFRLTGPMHLLSIPARHSEPTRTHGLWKDTCFEFFIGTQTSSAYWEFNLSPAGHWNVYHFDRYRQGMRREEAIDELPMNLSLVPNSMQLTLNIDLDKMNLTDRPIRLAVSAILAVKDNVKIYLALTHSGSTPDFHHPSGFLLAL